MKLTLKEWINKANAEFSDSGWKVLYSVSDRNIYYRKIGRIVFVEGYNLSVTHNTIIAYLPVGYRPSQRTLVPHSFPLNISAYVNITADGGINPIINGGGTNSQFYFHAVFPV